MAKKKAETKDLFAMVAESTGAKKLKETDAVRFFIDTGNLAINYGCSGKFIKGGIPGNKITEAFGPSSSGKSLIGSNLLYGAQRLGGWAVLLDCEDAANMEFMQRISHVDPERVLRVAPPSLEACFHQIVAMSKKIREIEKENGQEEAPIVVVFDSLTVPPCERELRENDLPLDATQAQWKKIVGRNEQPGERAKVISAGMRKLQAETSKLGVTVYIINQVRDKIGVLYGSPETTPGGKAVEFYASLRFRTSAHKRIEHKTLKYASGVNISVTNRKNRSFRPYVKAEGVKFYFEDGIDPVSGVLSCLIEAERVKAKSAGNYYVLPEYLPEGKTEYMFKASATENRMPTQVILDCPKLVDAATTEEVQEYLDCWASALMATDSGEYGERIIEVDADGVEFETEDYADEVSEEIDE